MDTLCSVIARNRCGPVLDDKGRCRTWQWSRVRSCISPAQGSLFWWSVTLRTIHLHFKTGSSSFQNLLSDWNSAKVEAAQCLCAGPPPLLKDSYLAHGIVCRACLCVRSFFFFFLALFFFLLTLVMTTIFKRKGRLSSHMLRNSGFFYVHALL